VPVGSYAPNAFGVHDTVGNVWEWVEDCWHGSYGGAPTDGGAWTAGVDCGRRVLRGGSWFNPPGVVRAADRYWYSTDFRNYSFGFRVARTLSR
jgi:formylglycine-generating enzyme required for sulfatase activity